MSQVLSRLGAGALVLLVLVVPAQAVAAPASLSATRLSAPPASLAPGASFTVTGRVANRTRRTSTALLAFKLRTKTNSLTAAVGSGALKSVPARGTKSFRAKLTVPSVLRGQRDLTLVVCVRRSRSATPVCRASAKTVDVAAGSSANSSTPPAPAPAAPAPTVTQAAPAPLPSDRIAPTTTDDVTSGRSSAPVPVTLTATDAGGSSVDKTYYAIDGTPTTASSVYDPARKPTLGDGQRISYFSVDTVGNVEPVKTSVAAVVDPTAYTVGARTLNDTLFPDIGNGGYDALHYDLDLDYVISTKYLKGTTTMTAKATQNLSGFSLDLAYWLRATKVLVDYEPATFDQGGSGSYKLDVTPATPIKDGEQFTVAVTYGGVEQAYIDPDGSSEGFVPSTTRGAIVVSEPVGAMGWYPNNNVPFDKATYTVGMSVPNVASGVEWSVVGPGVLQSKTVGASSTKYVWNETSPTASYLVGLGIGKYDVATTTTVPTGTNPPIPFTTAVDNAFTTGKATMLTNLGRTPSILDFYADFYGVNYPFSSAGGIVPLQNVQYSLETQSKPIYATTTTATSTGPGIGTIAHENGHMWFGDYTTLTQWKDIWLNEGMTEFSSWLWQERQNSGTTLASRFTTNYNTTSTTFWNVAPADPPTAADIFDTDAMYTRGAMTMIGLFDILGEAHFKDLMHTYLTEPAHVYGNATTEQFIALVKAKDLAWQTAASGPDRTARWTEFFRQWLYTEYTGTPAAGNRPSMTAANFDTYVLP